MAICWMRTIGCIIMSYAAMFLYKILHFDVEEREGKHHAVYLGGVRKFIWTYATIFECIAVILFGASWAELIVGVMENNERAIDHIHKSNHLIAVGMSIALATNMIARLAHENVIEEFKYAWELYIGQNVFQFIAICMVIPLRSMFSEELLLEHPWVRGFYICCILLLLNVLFFVDEVLNYQYLKDLVEYESKNTTVYGDKSIEMVVTPRHMSTISNPEINSKIISLDDHVKEEEEKRKQSQLANMHGENEIPENGDGMDC